MADLLLPLVATILERRDEAPDTRTFRLRLRDAAEQAAFRFVPGQFVELSVFGIGEAPFCLASSPNRHDGFEVTVRRCGELTDVLYDLGEGAEVGIRGPCGNGFDMAAAEGRDLVVVAGGIGLPPLRGLIADVLDRRDRFGRLTILYGARSPDDLVYKDELASWERHRDVVLRVTVDRAGAGWRGTVGAVPVLFDQVELREQASLAYVCGPPVMISFVVNDLRARGFADRRIISTLERMMQCGVGKCNHCCIGHRYVCRDGPVFDLAQIREMAE